MVLELITQWLNPLREFSAPSFTPQSESAAPLLALLYCTAVGGTLSTSRIPRSSTAVVRTVRTTYYVLPVPYSTVPVVRYSTVLAHSGSQ